MTGGADSAVPLIKNARHSTTVPLYSGRAKIVRVPAPTLTPGNGSLPTDTLFTFQPMKSASEWRHVKTASTPAVTLTVVGSSVKPINKENNVI